MRLKKIGSILLSLLLILALAFPVQATSNSISDLENKQSQIKENINAADSEIDNLESSQNELKTRVTDLNTQLSELSASLYELEEQVATKQDELAITQEELEVAKEDEAQQYEDMKKRIRFMYEKSDTVYIELLLSSESFTDFLNRAENISQISEYDRNMLVEYEATVLSVEEKETQIASEKVALEELQAQTETKQEEVSTLLASTSDEISTYARKIENAKQAKADYEATYSEQQSTLNQLIAEAEAEEKRKEEEAAAAKAAAAVKAKQEEEKKNTASTSSASNSSSTSSSSSTSNSASNSNSASANQNNTSTSGNSSSSSDQNAATPSADTDSVSLLAALIQCEAGGESYEGQLAVGAVVMNRVRSGSFPNTIVGVIYQSGQFSPVSSGRLLLVLSQGAKSSCVTAASAAINGSNNIGSCLYFKRADGTAGTVIGNHVFY